MPALQLLVVLLVPLLAGCVPGGGRSDGVPSADAPFTLVALDVGQGDATLLRTGQVAVLVDAGDPEGDVVRLLRREGVDRLDLLVIITLGAQVAVSPVLLLSFGTIEWVSVPANQLAVPIAAIGATIAFVGSAVALVHVGAASSVFALAGPAAAFVLWVVQVGARFTGGPTLPESPLLRAASVVVLGMLAVAVRRVRHRTRSTQ